MKSNFVVMFDDDGVTNLDVQMRDHSERVLRHLLPEQVVALAHVEGALMFGTVETALLEWERLSDKTKATAEAVELKRRIGLAGGDAAWWALAQQAMRDNLGGKTKMSRGGNAIIFSQPQCGRHDLSSWREFAQAQFDAAGITIG